VATNYQQQAATIVAEHVVRLRGVLADADARLAPALVDLRQVARTLDELNMRTAQHDQGVLVARQRKQLHERRATLEAEVADLQRVTQNIAQLIRQIELSSTALHAQGTPTDPWELALKAQVIHGREDERARLAREIHDGPAQVLAHLLLSLEHSITLTQQHTLDRLLPLLHMLRDTSRTGLIDMRRFIADLRPPTLAHQGLDAALRELCARSDTDSTSTVQYHGIALPRFTPEQEIVIYRVAQEAINNAVKHAPKATVEVRTHLADDQFSLAVQDNGPGFDPHTVAAQRRGRHWGLDGMHERAALVGAQLSVTSSIGQGTMVQLALPHSASGGTAPVETILNLLRGVEG
jgi:two-component system sensor histidine kinase DegS